MFFLLVLTLFFHQALADFCQNCYFPYFFYVKTGLGVSCSENSCITAPCNPWLEIYDGYSNKLGNSPIINFNVGCQFSDKINLELSYANRSIFKYRKCQKPIDSEQEFVRRFDLNINSLMVNIFLLGSGSCKTYYQMPCGKIYPIIGAGFGYSDLQIYNFRTTNLAPTGSSFPYHSFANENQYFVTRKFSYMLTLGLEYCFSNWAIRTGYNRFHTNRFNGPEYLRTNTGAAVDLECNTWNMNFKANEWFVDLRIFI